MTDVVTSSGRTADELREIAAEANERLEGATAHEIVQWAADTFGESLIVSQSMANASLAHVASQVIPGVKIAFLDTGYHFMATLKTRNAVAEKLDITLIEVKPRLSVTQQDIEFGTNLYARDPDLCCKMRKVEPLEEALVGYEAWLTGLRRANAPHRASTPTVNYDEKRGLVKVNPLVNWTDEYQLEYTILNDVPVNPLQYDGYPSIGCAPCTNRVGPGADPRAGRWAGRGKTECGLHT